MVPEQRPPERPTRRSAPRRGATASAPRRISLGRSDECTVCIRPLPSGTDAIWHPQHRTVTCLDCDRAVAVDGAEAGVAGRSARAEGERRRGQPGGSDEAPRSAGRLLGRFAGPETGRGSSWIKGAAGEQRLGDMLDGLAAGGAMSVLHDRRVPRSRANIDHVVVARTGVWVIDAKRFSGRIEVVGRGGASHDGARLVVDGTDRTDRLVGGVRRQVDHLRAALGPTFAQVDVFGALCFVAAGRRLVTQADRVDDVWVLGERQLRRRLNESGPLDEAWRRTIQRHVATRLRAAS